MIHIEDRGALRVVTLAHGPVNALDLELCAALTTAVEEAEDPAVHGLLLRAEGKAFSAGVDLLRILDEGEPYIRAFLPALTKTLVRLFALEKPVVAAVGGHAIAGGCLVALSADRRIMAAGRGKVGVPELKVGVPFPLIALEMLRFSLRPEVLGEVIGDGLLADPEGARELGLIHEVVPAEDLESRALEVLGGLADLPPAAHALTKWALRRPTLDRWRRATAEVDDVIMSQWCDPEALRRIRRYVDATLGGGKS